MRILFLGTPDFGVPSLRALHAAGHEIGGVFCQPDRPSGRGNKLTLCPVKTAALELSLPVYQFERIRGKEGLACMRALAPDVVVTAAFGQILSQKNLDIPKRGTINVHGSLLPKYRGAAPIQWAIIHGETETGVTTMLTAAGIDTGDILLCEKTAIGDNETAGELFTRLADMGARLIVQTLDELDDITPVPQSEAEATHCPMLTKEHGRIDFARTVQEVRNLVRGCDPWPAAHFEVNGKTIKVYGTQNASGEGVCGSVLCADERRGLVVACADGAVELTEIQVPGGKRMSARDWLRGHQL